VKIHREHAGKSRKAEQHAQLNAASAIRGANV
jgi:hypothetical protein